MISFFRINDPFRLVFVFLLLLILRLPAFIGEISLTTEEQTLMLLGEKLGTGVMIYRDVDTSVGPFAAFFYWVIDIFFGKTPLAYHIFSMVFIMIQAAMLNFTLNKYDVLPERTYLPALIYVILSFWFFDFYSMAPVMIAITFMLPAVDQVFKMLKTGNTDQGMFFVGFCISCATLCYFPSFVFLLMLCLVLLFYTSTVPRRYAILLFGFLFPLILVATYFFFFSALQPFSYDFLLHNLKMETIKNVGFVDMLKLIVLPGIFLLLSFLKASNVGLIIFQSKCRKVMFFWILLAAMSFLFGNQTAPFQLFLFVPPLAYYFSHYFMLIRRKIMKSLMFYLLFFGILTISYGHTKILNNFLSFVDLSDYLVKEVPREDIQNEKILVLGNMPEYYRNNRVATRYFQWSLCKEKFENINTYDVLPEIYLELKKDMPAYIISKREYAPNLVGHVLEFQRSYVMINTNPFIFKRRD